MSVRSRRAALAIVLLTLVGATALAACTDRDPIVKTAPTLVDGEVPQRDTSFYPDDPNMNVTDCISSLPRPGCGSKARGGWRQGLTFAVLAAALVVVGWRLSRAWRGRDRRPVATSADGMWATSTPAAATSPEQTDDREVEEPDDP